MSRLKNLSRRCALPLTKAGVAGEETVIVHLSVVLIFNLNLFDGKNTTKQKGRYHIER